MILRSVLIAVTAVLGFFTAFFLQGTPGDAVRAAATFALLSAVAWGLGSIGGPAVWSNGSNVFAALAAAIATGFGVPSDPACDGGYLKTVCEIRSHGIERGLLPLNTDPPTRPLIR